MVACSWIKQIFIHKWWGWVYRGVKTYECNLPAIGSDRSERICVMHIILRHYRYLISQRATLLRLIWALAQYSMQSLNWRVSFYTFRHLSCHSNFNFIPFRRLVNWYQQQLFTCITLEFEYNQLIIETSELFGLWFKGCTTCHINQDESNSTNHFL